MSNSSHYVQEGEFLLLVPTLKIFAPLEFTDAQSELLLDMLEPMVEGHLAAMKASVEQKFSEVRVGYTVD